MAAAPAVLAAPQIKMMHHPMVPTTTTVATRTIRLHERLSKFQPILQDELNKIQSGVDKGIVEFHLEPVKMPTRTLIISDMDSITHPICKRQPLTTQSNRKKRR
jgi:hypothetical protein